MSDEAITDGGDVAAVLERAADLIEPEGRWVQGDLKVYDEAGMPCWCAIGALFAAAPNLTPVTMEPIRKRVEAVLGLSPAGNGDIYPLALWNDAPDRTQAEVVDALRKAAALAKAHPQGGES